MFSLKSVLSANSLMAAAVLAGIGGAQSVSAHHLASERGYFTVFWHGYQAPSETRVFSENRLPPQFWKKAFVSIYAQGGDLGGLK